MDNLKAADASVRRAVGAGVASRALSIATRGSLGVFLCTGALVFYASGCSTTEDAVQVTREWAQSGRRRFYEFWGIPDPLGHPDYAATRGMTEEEELEYLSKTYFTYEEPQEEK